MVDNDLIVKNPGIACKLLILKFSKILPVFILILIVEVLLFITSGVKHDT